MSGVQRREDTPAFTMLQDAGVSQVHGCQMVDAKVEVDFTAGGDDVENIDVFVKLGGVIETASEEVVGGGKGNEKQSQRDESIEPAVDCHKGSGTRDWATE